MATPPFAILLLLLLLLPLCSAGVLTTAPPPRSPADWPVLFRAELRQNRSGALANTTLCYDWKGGRNLNIIRNDGGSTLMDNERANGSTYYYPPDGSTCKAIAMGVGILTPTWLHGARFVGSRTLRGEACNCFTQGKAVPPATGPFLTYCARASDGLPLQWTFFDGAIFDVRTFVTNATCTEAEWQLPARCFSNSSDDEWARQRRPVAARRRLPRLP